MYDEHSHQRENTPDPLTEFLAKLLAGIPTPIIAHTPPSLSSFASASASTSVPDGNHDSNPYLTCQWISPNTSPFICGAALSQEPKFVCDHFRYTHDVRGNEKVHVDCHWRHCLVPPMLRGSLIRHVLTVHLGLLRWRCEVCGKVFSRKGTVHVCAEGR